VKANDCSGMGRRGKKEGSEEREETMMTKNNKRVSESFQ